MLCKHFAALEKPEELMEDMSRFFAQHHWHPSFRDVQHFGMQVEVFSWLRGDFMEALTGFFQ